MSIRRIIFWQPFASPHQEAFLEAVAEQFSGDVILGVERPNLPPERVAQGWREPKHVRVRVIDISKPENHAMLAGHRSAESLHVFTGFFSHQLVWAGFHKLADSQAGLAIYSEAPEQPPLTGWIKRARGRLLAARWAKRFAFLLAVGGIGCDFFEQIGFAKEKIVSFGYFFEVSPGDTRPAVGPASIFRFISAGQLIYRKGIDILIKACATLPESGWHLDIFGDGPQRRPLERLAKSLNLTARVTFHGMVPNDTVRSALAAGDCAVLPSRFDGWGALVNESLSAGTPIICTRGCGGATVVAGDAVLGCVVATASPGALAAALKACLRRASPWPPRAGVAAAASEGLSANGAAARFLEAGKRLCVDDRSAVDRLCFRS